MMRGEGVFKKIELRKCGVFSKGGGLEEQAGRGLVLVSIGKTVSEIMGKVAVNVGQMIGQLLSRRT